VGTGLTAGTTIAISGSGITLSGIVFQSGSIFVTIAVDAAATTGPRNVSMTSPDFDTSIMTGGLFIR
jgi:hypothetical protein